MDVTAYVLRRWCIVCAAFGTVWSGFWGVSECVCECVCVCVCVGQFGLGLVE